MELLSHDDKLLSEHIAGLKKIVDVLIGEKIQKLFPDDVLSNIINILVSYHDLGKASIYFQLYLANSLVQSNIPHKYYSLNDLKLFLKNNSDNLATLHDKFELKNHSLVGAFMAINDSYLKNLSESDKYIIFLALLCHHGDLKSLELSTVNVLPKRELLQIILSNINLTKLSELLHNINLKVNFADVNKLFLDYKVRTINNTIRIIKNETNCANYLKTLFLYSLLLSADKGDVMLNNNSNIERIHLKSDIIDEYKSKYLTSRANINVKREEAYKCTIDNLKKNNKSNFYSITLPTGLGKTLISLNVAFNLKRLIYPNFRIIYCLPFTSIIDQNADIIKRVLSSAGYDRSVLNVHHHLTIPDEGIDTENKYSEWEYFVDGWQSEITITTFVQLWDSIFTCKNRNIRKFHNLVNSIIILDEVQQIKPGLIRAFEFLAEYLNKYFNTQFIFVSATQPLILKDKVKELSINKTNSYFFENLNRTVIKKDLLNKNIFMAEDKLSDIVVEKYKGNPLSTLIICNTIKYSQKLFNLLNESKDINCKIFYLSASIIPFSRQKVLLDVNKCLNNKEKIILVSTQVIEAGVDIDFELVYRDLSPMSSINQAAGRCNRNNSNNNVIGNVYLFDSGKKRIYDPVLLEITESIIYRDVKIIEEKDYHTINEEYFKKVYERIQNLSNDSYHLIEDINSLNFERICSNTNYRLIDKQHYTNKIFIPINDEAFELWKEFLNYLKIENRYEKKRKIKTIFPKLSYYSVDIPNYIYKPDNDEKGKSIIYCNNWNDIYDETLGYKYDVNNNTIEFI